MCGSCTLKGWLLGIIIINNNHELNIHWFPMPSLLSPPIFSCPMHSGSVSVNSSTPVDMSSVQSLCGLTLSFLCPDYNILSFIYVVFISRGCCEACVGYYRQIMSFLPGGMCILATVVLATLIPQTLGVRRKKGMDAYRDLCCQPKCQWMQLDCCGIQYYIVACWKVYLSLDIM